ncbi:site-specific integrase [Candidatus Enterovibrio escicola]|uniref:hypothetical protein n=1 Tax=Candidatus Enterovibrio escicola TaxID=1927127 RepID=UPI001CC2A3DF|nr:hypothetical protein [Candidatus Enterovibrio escacola]
MLSFLKNQSTFTGERRRKTVNILQRDHKSFRKESIDFLFLNSSTREPFLNARQFGKSFFNPFLEKIGIAHRGADQFRHTFAAECLTVGISKEWISNQMDHTGTNIIGYALWKIAP